MRRDDFGQVERIEEEKKEEVQVRPDVVFEKERNPDTMELVNAAPEEEQEEQEPELVRGRDPVDERRKENPFSFRDAAQV